MSRSIHDTRRSAQRAWLDARRTGDELIRHEAEVARANIHRQRAIKRRLREQRGRTLAPLAPDDVPIRIEPAAAHVYHAVTADDLREVMRRLPPGRLDGLAAIELCLGGDGRAEDVDADTARDPYTGTPGSERLPGVFTPPVWGRYNEDGVVRLYAFVIAGELAPFIAMYLRLQALSTFVHELAHHFDYTFRTRGDRWRMDDREKNETFARELELEHLTTCVVPYLAERYPDEHAALVAEVAQRSGTAIPLDVLVDSRTYASARVDRAFCDAMSEDDRTAARVGFARALHDAEHDDLATSIVDVLLAEDPSLIDARLVQASIALRRGELDRAESIIGAVRGESPDRGRYELAELLRARARWNELAVFATEWLDDFSLSTVARVYRVRAWIALARWDDAAADIELVRGRAKRTADVFAAWLCFARGDHRKALAAAHRLFKLGGIVLQMRAELAAIRCECARSLGQMRATWELSPDDIAALRSRGLDRHLTSL